MGLIQKLYPQDEKTLEKHERVLDRFFFFCPDVRFLGFKVLREAFLKNDRGFFVQQIRDTYLPEQADKEIQEIYRDAINRGIEAINSLVRDYMGGYAHHFLMQEVPEPMDFFDFLIKARDDWIRAKTGRLPHLTRNHAKHKLIFQAYDRVRAWGLGYHVMMIDEALEVNASLKDYDLALKWLKERFEFSNPTPVIHEDFSHVWQTKAGVKVYGSSSEPIRSRLKNMNIKTGMPEYSSIIMKMLLKGEYPDKIRDYTGVEFVVVESRDDVERLLSFFRRLKGTGKLEGFDDREIRERRGTGNELSSPGFDCTKFIMRPPVRIPVPRYSSRSFAYERVPVEVQILTLDAHEQRKRDPELRHDSYKKRQFRATVPILFPLQIYQHFLPGTS